MKCQFFCSDKMKKNVINLSSVELAQRVLTFNIDSQISFSNRFCLFVCLLLFVVVVVVVLFFCKEPPPTAPKCF